MGLKGQSLGFGYSNTVWVWTLWVPSSWVVGQCQMLSVYVGLCSSQICVRLVDVIELLDNARCCLSTLICRASFTSYRTTLASARPSQGSRNFGRWYLFTCSSDCYQHLCEIPAGVNICRSCSLLLVYTYITVSVVWRDSVIVRRWTCGFDFWLFHFHVMTLGKLFKHIFLCHHSPSSIIWYRQKDGDALWLGRHKLVLCRTGHALQT